MVKAYTSSGLVITESAPPERRHFHIESDSVPSDKVLIAEIQRRWPDVIKMQKPILAEGPFMPEWYVENVKDAIGEVMYPPEGCERWLVPQFDPQKTP